MKSQWHNGSYVRALACLAVATAFALTGAQTATAQELPHARVSFEDGSALIRGGSDDDWSFATVNTLVMPGDSLWADQGGTIELELSGGTFLRLADGSRAEVSALPPGGLIRGQTGSFYIQRTQRSSGSIGFDTPAARIDVDPNTHVRVDIVGEGATTVSVRWGRVTVKSPGGSPMIVTEGKRTYVDPGYLPSTPQYFDANLEDSFDAWARERAKLLAVGPQTTPKYVTPAGDAPLGYYDLEPYGNWVTVDNTPYWRPTVVSNYVPYRTGYWSYVPNCGYTWVGGYPFSYITTHYGRWNYNNNYGWLWCYRDTWSPAWAYTARYGDYYVWSPLDIYDRPCYFGDAYFNIGGIRIGINTSSYCHYNNVFYGPSYVYPCGTSFFNNVRANNVYIWNIYAPNSTININTRYGNLGSALVRDYTPQRYIRGLDSSLRSTASGERVFARSRAVQLENTVHRAAFDTARDGSQRGLRTAMREGSRNARIRDVNVSEEARHETRLLASRDIDSWAAQTVRNRDARGGKPNNTETPGRAERTTTPSGTSDRIPATTGGEPNRFRTDRDKPRGDGNNADTQTIRTPRATREQTQPSDATVTRDRGRTDSVGRGQLSSPSTHSAPRTTVPPSDVATRVPTRNVRGVEGRGDTSRDFKLPQTRGSAPAERGIDAGDQGSRTIKPRPERTEVPGRDYAGVPPSRNDDSMRTPSRRDATMTEAPRATEPRTPRYETPRTEAPRVETPRYEAPQQRETPRYEAPQPRHEAPQQRQAPRYEAPQPRYEAPQQRQAPRQEAPQPRYEAPPQHQAPRYEAPQQREAPRYEAPRQEAPRFESPSRSFGGSDNSDRSRGGGGDSGGGRGRSK
jgi:hypothetical protein